MTEEPQFHHRGEYEGHYGYLEMAFAMRESARTREVRDPSAKLYFTTVEIQNALDFEAIRADAAGMDQDRYHEDEDPMAQIVGTILDAAMVGGANAGDADNPAAGGFGYSWADDGSWIEIDYTPLTIRLMSDGAVRVSASG